MALSRDHLAALLGEAGEPLDGRPAPGCPDPGPTLCACLGVGARAIREAIGSGRAMTVEAVGALLGAGTNCGSCRPEIRAMIVDAMVREAAE